jgi:hypothetical protein
MPIGRQIGYFRNARPGGVCKAVCKAGHANCQTCPRVPDPRIPAAWSARLASRPRHLIPAGAAPHERTWERRRSRTGSRPPAGAGAPIEAGLLAETPRGAPANKSGGKRPAASISRCARADAASACPDTERHRRSRRKMASRTATATPRTQPRVPHPRRAPLVARTPCAAREGRHIETRFDRHELSRPCANGFPRRRSQMRRAHS